MNNYKKMLVLSAKSAEELADQIKSLPYLFDIVSIYGMSGRHYAFLNMDRPVRIVKSKEKNLDLKSINEINEKLKE